MTSQTLMVILAHPDDESFVIGRTLASLLIAAVIVLGTCNLFRQSLHLLFDGVPEHIDLTVDRSYLESLPGVERVHDLHVWAMGTSELALTAHLVMPAGHPSDSFFQTATQLTRRSCLIAEAIPPICGDSSSRIKVWLKSRTSN